jgi:GABA permease
VSRVLVIANETVGADALLAELRRIEDEKTSQYYVQVPARPLHERHGAVWTQEGAIDAARQRLDSTLAVLAAEGLSATGGIGDMRPLAAIADALIDFDADLIVISTHPEPRSGWLRTGLVEKARRRFHRPVVHVVASGVTASA